MLSVHVKGVGQDFSASRGQAKDGLRLRFLFRFEDGEGAG